EQFPLARETARYAGQPIVFIVAESASQAEDAAEKVAIDYEPLAAAVGLDEALGPHAPLVWGDRPSKCRFSGRAATAAPSRRRSLAPRTSRGWRSPTPGSPPSSWSRGRRSASTTRRRHAGRSGSDASRPTACVPCSSTLWESSRAVSASSCQTQAAVSAPAA